MEISSLRPVVGQVSCPNLLKNSGANQISDNSISFSGGNNPSENDKKYSKKQLYAALLASTIGSAAIVGAIMHGRTSRIISRFERSINDLSVRNRRLSNDASDLKLRLNREKSDNATLLRDKEQFERACESLKSSNEQLKGDNARLQERLNAAIEASNTPEEKALYARYKAQFNGAELDYDPTRPPVTGIVNPSKAKGPVYPAEHVPTSLRSDIVDSYIPPVGGDGRFDFRFSTSPEMHITKVESKDFEPMSKVSTSISESYADSVQWNNDKIARDILQNFYDGHGQTLDGVRLHFEPVSNGRYKIRIEGLSTYSPDKAIFIGESTKRNDPNAAGNYGEGLKMAALKLLRDKGATKVDIGSDNWKLSYSLDKSSLADKRVLTYSMDKTPKYDGNYVEFETSDKDLLEKFRLTLKRFYSSGNSHFKCPDFENSYIGIKKLGPKEKGGLYIAGQRFEFGGDYDGLPGVVLFVKQKPPIKVLDPSRDRTSINTSQLENIAQWIAENASRSEKLSILKALEEYGYKVDYSKETPMHNFVRHFVNKCKYADIPLKDVQFPANYVAYSSCDDDIVRSLRQAGYMIFDEQYQFIGMRTISQVVGDARKHVPVLPNSVQQKKILILKEALKKLAPALEGRHFTPKELDTKVFTFDKNSPGENRMYGNCLAEAITDFGKSLGFWIDREYLDGSKFSDVLETALHELSHKAGGDSNSSFGYKLTNVNQDVIKQILTNPRTKAELSALNRLWDELTM